MSVKPPGQLYGPQVIMTQSHENQRNLEEAEGKPSHSQVIAHEQPPGQKWGEELWYHCPCNLGSSFDTLVLGMR